MDLKECKQELGCFLSVSTDIYGGRVKNEQKEFDVFAAWLYRIHGTEKVKANESFQVN